MNNATSTRLNNTPIKSWAAESLVIVIVGIEKNCTDGITYTYPGKNFCPARLNLPFGKTETKPDLVLIISSAV
jgi:hypothetical protein